MIGKPTETDANACGPRNLPTHMLSTVLYAACSRFPMNIGVAKAMRCFGMLPVVKSVVRTCSIVLYASLPSVSRLIPYSGALLPHYRVSQVHSQVAYAFQAVHRLHEYHARRRHTRPLIQP